jgi:hypothetical protein
MAHFRIVQRPRGADPTQARFDIEERVWLQWEGRGWFFDLEKAESQIAQIQEERRNTIKTKVIKEYN